MPRFLFNVCFVDSGSDRISYRRPLGYDFFTGLSLKMGVLTNPLLLTRAAQGVYPSTKKVNKSLQHCLRPES